MTAWLWGKLPAHGDFVGRGLGADARDTLAGWLAGSLDQARGGADWEERYDSAPPWRFAWRDGAGWTAGALAPSADGVGRRYPILLALDGLDATRVETGAALVEALLYDALGEDWTADRLQAAAAASAPEPGTPWTRGEGWWTLGADGSNDGWLAGARPAGLIGAVLSRAAPAGGTLNA